MGVYVHLFITPTANVPIPQTTFLALARALVQEQLVTLPGAVLVGHMEQVSSLLHLNNLVWGRTHEEAIQVDYRGEQADQLLHALEQVEYGSTDVVVWFAGLNHQHPALAAWELLERSCEEVGLYALTQPREVTTWEGAIPDTEPHDYQLQQYLLVGGEWAPFTLEDTALMTTLQRYFGSVEEHASYL